MNALQRFIESKPYGFLVAADIPELIKLDRLCPVLVRCGGCRFTCGAQNVEHLLKCVVAGGDYVRDVSLPVGSKERAASWAPEGMPLVIHRAAQTKAENLLGTVPDRRQVRNEEGVDWICTGNFDGFICGTDADPGL